MTAIDYEALRARHAQTRPMQHLTTDELTRLRESTAVWDDLRDLAFLAALEVNARVTS